MTENIIEAKLDPHWFSEMADCRKTYEIRRYSGKWKTLETGNIIRFRSTGYPENFVLKAYVKNFKVIRRSEFSNEVKKVTSSDSEFEKVKEFIDNIYEKEEQIVIILLRNISIGLCDTDSFLPLPCKEYSRKKFITRNLIKDLVIFLLPCIAIIIALS